MRCVSQALILLLMIDAAWVAYGLALKKNRWRAIVIYWVVLTFKNLVDFAAGWW
ncbi:MAG: hypothetical protein J5556_03455 [Deltaproteobacteria bacterium]|nr:hypothetical protein [Deltaproteobacteria bacterium]